jgi:hypothetical protein
MTPEDRSDLVRRVDIDYVNYFRPLVKEGDVWLYEIIGWPH